jgi:hypothetical protein
VNSLEILVSHYPGDPDAPWIAEDSIGMSIGIGPTAQDAIANLADDIFFTWFFLIGGDLLTGDATDLRDRLKNTLPMKRMPRTAQQIISDIADAAEHEIHNLVEDVHQAVADCGLPELGAKVLRVHEDRKLLKEVMRFLGVVVPNMEGHVLDLTAGEARYLKALIKRRADLAYPNAPNQPWETSRQGSFPPKSRSS